MRIDTKILGKLSIIEETLSDGVWRSQIETGVQNWFKIIKI